MNEITSTPSTLGIPSALAELLHQIDSNGGRGYIVGGTARDYFLGIDNKDYDVEVHGLTEKELRSVLSNTAVDEVGVSFSVFKVHLFDKTIGKFTVDLSLPRTEKKIGDGHTGFEVTSDPFLGLKEAARRRDFTMNAIMIDPLNGDIFDFYGGQEDILNKTIRVVDPKTFVEDSLRVLRAMQFAARFEFQADYETTLRCLSIDLSDLPAERLYGEFEKMLLAKKPSMGLQFAKDSDILNKLFPDIVTSDTLSFAIVKAALDNAISSKEDGKGKMMAIQLSLLGGLLRESHTLESVLDKLKVYTIEGYDVRRNVLYASQAAMYGTKDGKSLTDEQIRRLSLTADIDLLYKVLRSVFTVVGRVPPAVRDLRIRAAELGCLNNPVAPLLMGRHVLELGVSEGKRVGEICKQVFEKQLAGQVSTLEEAITKAKTLL